MNRDAAIEILSRHADDIRALDVRSLYLFGSTARNQAGEDSDVDLFLDYDENSDFSLIELARLQTCLSEILNARADVTTRDGLHPLIKDDIIRSAERVF